VGTNDNSNERTHYGNAYTERAETIDQED